MHSPLHPETSRRASFTCRERERLIRLC